ncbi:MAG: hypothetical protein KI792_02515 [Alphaproteobacteria bacterium]|nr:hypothetical protein [Alphaproteobacteria bacterium SS10]
MPDRLTAGWLSVIAFLALLTAGSNVLAQTPRELGEPQTISLDVEVHDIQRAYGVEDGICAYLSGRLRFSTEQGLIFPDEITVPEWQPATAEELAFFRERARLFAVSQIGFMEWVQVTFFDDSSTTPKWSFQLPPGQSLEATEVTIAGESTRLIRLSDPHMWRFSVRKHGAIINYRGNGPMVSPYDLDRAPELIEGLNLYNLNHLEGLNILHVPNVGFVPANDVVIYQGEPYGVRADVGGPLSLSKGFSPQPWLALSDDQVRALIEPQENLRGRVLVSPLKELGLQRNGNGNYCHLYFPGQPRQQSWLYGISLP